MLKRGSVWCDRRRAIGTVKSGSSIFTIFWLIDIATHVFVGFIRCFSDNARSGLSLASLYVDCLVCAAAKYLYTKGATFLRHKWYSGFGGYNAHSALFP